MRLPAPLAPWAAQLAIFPTDVALSLGPAIRRLSAAIGEWPVHPEGDSGDPDGFDGLARRGSYERLLASEWLLADVYPEEFLRRAGVGEHTFLRLARPQRAAHRHCAVLLDAGPEQIGTPRLAHIAALIVLARRAAAARAGFTWGVLQHGLEHEAADLTADTLHRLLEARSALEATAADVSRWRTSIDARWPGGDVWMVGGRRAALAAAHGPWSSVAVRDVLEPAARQVDVVVRTPRRAAAPLTLELPDDAMCTRLLRNPTARPASALGEAAFGTTPSRHLVFSSNGTRILVRSKEGHIASYLVSGTSKDPLAKPVVFRTAYAAPVIAVDHNGKSLVAVMRHDTWIHVEEFSKRGQKLREHHYSVETLRPLAEDTPGLRTCLRVDDAVYFHDPSGVVGRLDGHGRKLAVVSGHAAALSPMKRGGLALVERATTAPDALGWHVVLIHGDARHWLRVSEAVSIEIHLGFEAGKGGYPMMAVSEDGRTFRVWWDGEMKDVVVPRGSSVIGICRGSAHAPGLVVLDKEAGRLLQLGPTGSGSQPWSRNFGPVPADLQSVAFSPSTGRVAFLTTRGELSVYSLTRAEVLCRWLWLPAGAADPS